MTKKKRKNRIRAVPLFYILIENLFLFPSFLFFFTLQAISASLSLVALIHSGPFWASPIYNSICVLKLVSLPLLPCTKLCLLSACISSVRSRSSYKCVCVASACIKPIIKAYLYLFGADEINLNFICELICVWVVVDLLEHIFFSLSLSVLFFRSFYVISSIPPLSLSLSLSRSIIVTAFVCSFISISCCECFENANFFVYTFVALEWLWNENSGKFQANTKLNSN